MNARISNSAMRIGRLGLLEKYLRFSESEGVRVEPLLARAGIPKMLLDYPEALVCEDKVSNCIEGGCRALGNEHVSIHLLRPNALEDYRAYCRMLENSLTVYDYLRRGTLHSAISGFTFSLA